MKRPVFAWALVVAERNRRLTSDCEALVTALALSNKTYERQRQALAQAIHERDDSLALVVDLRADLEALRAQVTLLMEWTPTDLRGLPDAG